MATQETKTHRTKAALETLRYFTAATSLVMGTPISAAHADAIAHYAARKLPAVTLGRLRSKSGGKAALAFILQLLQQPQIVRPDIASRAPT